MGVLNFSGGVSGGGGLCIGEMLMGVLDVSGGGGGLCIGEMLMRVLDVSGGGGGSVYGRC